MTRNRQFFFYLAQSLLFYCCVSGELTSVCGLTRFRCSMTNLCIFSRYMCDGIVDCSKDGSDDSDESEQVCKTANPCEQKFMCNNSRCIDHKLVCDNADSCGDNSDELFGCIIKQGEELNPVQTTSRQLGDENEHFNWLKTTVYTIIGCTVATVLLISFIVIIVFRLKMKRLRARRLAHQMERHRRHLGEGTSDQDPFLAFNTHSHFGNIIVNVNNGVQCVRSAVFQRDKPPPYSEVVSRSDFAPPPYSTIDRANRRQQAGGDVDSLASSARGGASPSGFSGMALIGPPLSHPAREHYLQHAAAAALAASATANSSPAGSMLALSDMHSASQRNSTTSDLGRSSVSEGQAPLLPPPPRTPPTPPPAAPVQTRSQDELATPPVPPMRTTSILNSGAGNLTPDDLPPPLPPRNDPPLPPPPPPIATPSLPPPSPVDTLSLSPPSPITTPSHPPPTPLGTPSLPAPTPICTTPTLPPSTLQTGTPSPPIPAPSLPLPPCTLLQHTAISPHSPVSHSPAAASVVVSHASPSVVPSCFGGSLGRGGNLVVQEGKIILASPNAFSSPSGSASSTPVAAGYHRDSSCLPHSSKLEVRHGQIVLNVSKDEDSPSQGGGCELQVKDGKIIFKR